jgi:hypothetical protein
MQQLQLRAMEFEFIPALTIVTVLCGKKRIRDEEW